MSEELAWWRWFIEWQTPFKAHMIAVKEYVYSGRTKYQNVDIVVTHQYGKCLLLDGKLQSSEADEWIYHEALVHPAMMACSRPAKVAIVGGGEGATLREVLRHRCVEKALMIDLDEELVSLCRKYLPEWSQGAFEDPRSRILFSDGRRFMERCDEEFDVIILDLTDPVPGTPSVLLYTREFYTAVSRRLAAGGVVVTQATSTYYSLDTFATIYRTMASVFPMVKAYHVYVPSFGSTWGFVLASSGADPSTIDFETFKRRISDVKGEMRFYSWSIHNAMFALPKYVLDRIKACQKIATDENPTYMPA